jgi:hypothetical protein
MGIDGTELPAAWQFDGGGRFYGYTSLLASGCSACLMNEMPF